MSASSLYPSTLGRERPSLFWVGFAYSLCALSAAALFFVPAFIILPFRHQGPRALLLAMTLRQRAPPGRLVPGLPSLALPLALWRTSSRWRKSLLVLTLLVVSFSA